MLTLRLQLKGKGKLLGCFGKDGRMSVIPSEQLFFKHVPELRPLPKPPLVLREVPAH